MRLRDGGRAGSRAVDVAVDDENCCILLWSWKGRLARRFWIGMAALVWGIGYGGL